MPTIHNTQLNTYLNSAKMPLLFLIASDVTLLQHEARDAIRKKAIAQGFQQREMHTVETGFSWINLFINLNNYNLFSEKTFVEIHNPSAKFDDHALHYFTEYAKQPIPDKIIVILTDKLTTAQQKSRWYKTIENAGVCLLIRSMTKTELSQWILQRASQRHLKLDNKSAALLAELTEGNLLATQQALDQLNLLYSNQKIEVDQVMQIITHNARYSVFDLGQYALAGQAHNALRCLQGLKDTGVEATLILWSLCRELRELADIFFQRQQGIALQELLQRQWQQRRPLLQQAVNRLSANNVNNLLLQAQTIDQMIKGLQMGNPWDALQQFILHFSLGNKV